MAENLDPVLIEGHHSHGHGPHMQEFRQCSSTRPSMDGPSPSSQVSPIVGKDDGKTYPSLLSRPSSSDACATIVQGLMMFNQSPDEEFSRKACESLVKKMKDKRDELDALIVSVYSRGDDAKKCITIARTLDGRLQVAGRKGFPHVVYAKIFRWPDLHKNELKHLSFCENAFDLKADNVCVNPYHYERVINAGMGGIEVKGEEEEIIQITDVDKQTPSYFGMKPSGSQVPTPMPPPMASPMQQLPPLQMQGIGRGGMVGGMSGGPKPPMMSPTSQVQTNRYMNFNSQMGRPSMSNMMMNQNPPYPVNPHNLNQQRIAPPSQMMPPSQMPMRPPQQGLPPSSSKSWETASQKAWDAKMMPPPSAAHRQALLPSDRRPVTAPKMPNISPKVIRRPRGCPNIDPIENGPQHPPGHPLCEKQNNYKTISNLTFSRRNIVCTNNQEPENPPMDLQRNWISLVYHEKTEQMSEFTALTSTIYIDGGFAGCLNRWCLGGEPREELTADQAEKLTKIGRGVRLSCKINGDIWIQVLSNNPVFVQSHYLDRESGRTVGDVIHKIYPGARLKIYDAEQSRKIMREQWLSSLMHRCRVITRGVADDDLMLGDTLIDEHGVEHPVPLAKDCPDDPMSELFRFCLARISFIEGWGPDFPNRRTIDECSCWIEIKLNQAFAYLDRILTEFSDRL